jgi:D-serine deaminase-like pyridoxal phosphate-dependent protein
MSLNRRQFLAASVATGAVAGAAFLAEEKLGNLTKADLPTPALLVDLDAFDANLKRMADHCKKAGVGFRPHAKTHKCPEIARRQVASGALGQCVATVPEAEALVAGGVKGILLTSPIMERGKIARMVALAKQEGAVLLAVGHVREAELLTEAAAAAALTVDVVVDVDVGDRRTGILPGGPALDLAQRISKSKHLRLRGIQAYSGRSSHTKGFEARQKVSQEAMATALETRDLFTKAGLDAGILSGGSTGTYNIDTAIKGITELQVGSYIFMDVEYRAIGGKDAQVYTDFRPSLTVLTTVVSATHPDRVSIDAGNKAFSTDVPYKPEAKNWPGLTYGRGGDEFGILTAEGDVKLPKLGDRLEFIIPHCDPTVNLYDRIHATRGEKVVAIWPIAARKEFAGNKSGS